MSYNRAYALINIDAIRENLKIIKSSVPEGVMIMGIVKADAYGHGAVSVCRSIINDVDYFGVSCIDEATELRRAGIVKPILILGYTSPEDFRKAVENNIILTVFDYASAEKLSAVAEALKAVAEIHIKTDTGMRRIGFEPTRESAAIVKKIGALPNIKIAGVFSHYATSDERDKTNAQKQRKLFDEFTAYAENEGIEFPVKHISNSAAAAEMDSYYNMVRVGITMYGLSPSNNPEKAYEKFIPAMEVHSHVTFVKTVPAGEGIGYGYKYVTEKETKVATVAVGYADGIFRAMSDRGYVLINGHKCNILGNICMDQMMVDVTDGGEIKTGDDVVLLGKSKNRAISAEEAAALAGTVNYEIVCAISRRVPRIYTENGKEVMTVSYLKNMQQI